MSVKSIMEWALEYALSNIYVIPLYGIIDGKCSCGNMDCRSPGKHPAINDWRKQASIDPSIIGGWFRKWPNANVGVVTGKLGFYVLDIDPRHGGNESLVKLQEQYGTLPSPQVKTGGGGFHIYMVHQQEGEIRNKVNLDDFSGIDLRGDGGYVVAPPSLHISGGRYDWLI